MNLYIYKVEDATGMTLRGKIKAESKAEALAKMPAYNKLLAFKDNGPIVELPPIIQEKLHLNRVPNKVLTSFLGQLAYMIGAGIAVPRALSVMSTTGEPSVQLFASKLLDSMNSGTSLGEAYEKYSYMTYGDYGKFIRVGESAGNLEVTLQRISTQIQSQNDIKQKVTSALIYPVGILCLAIGAAYFVFTAIIPQMASLLTELGNGELPVFTQVVMAISDFLISYGPVTIALMVAAGFLLKWVVKTYFPFQRDALKLKIPILGKIIRTSQFIIFYQNIAFMLESGFPMPAAFRSSQETVTNKFINRQLSYAYDAIMEGKALPQALSALSIVLPMEIQTLDVGMSTGKINELLGKLTHNMGKDMDILIKNLLAAMEPLLMILLVAVVGVLLLSVYGPTFSMMSIG